MKVLGVVLDRSLTFEKHVTMVARSCHYHAQAIRHIRHLLSTELASTLARSLILTRLDYCNSLLHGSHTSSTARAEQRRQDCSASTEAVPRKHAAVPAPLAAGSSQNQIQAGSGCDDEQDPQHRFTCIPESSHQPSRNNTNITFI